MIGWANLIIDGEKMDHIIKTNRLHLLPMNESDISFIQDLAANPVSFKYDRENAPQSDEVAERCEWYIKKTETLPDKGAILWIVIGNDVKIGEVHVVCNWEETHEWEIGWYLLPEYWGKGYATEAAKSVIVYVFTNFKINRLAAFLNAENERSAALAERIGMLKEGRMRETKLVNGIYYDEYVFSILKREFRLRH